MKITQFHIAVHVRDIEEAINYYVNILELEVGKSDKNWVDFNMF